MFLMFVFDYFYVFNDVFMFIFVASRGMKSH